MSKQQSKYRFIESTEEDPLMVIPAKSVIVATFNKDISGMARPEEVHMYLAVEGIADPVAVMLKSPRQLADLIRELVNAGRVVWKPPSRVPELRKQIPVA
jgi:hypothetical protein